MDESYMKFLEERIRAGVDAARALGYKIVTLLYVNERDKCCCPVGACMITDPTEPTYLMVASEYAKRAWAMNPTNLKDFTNGFDGIIPQEGVTPYYQLGQKLREEYIK